MLSRPRTLVKAAGLTLLILGGFFAVTAGLPAATLLQPGYWDTIPGGNLTVAVPGHSAAPVRLLYPGGLDATTATTDPSGNATLHASRARFTLEVEAGGRTLRGDGILPEPASLAVTVDPQAASASIPHIGYPEWLGWGYAGAAAWGVLLALGGLAAFRLKGYRLAATAAFLHVGLTLFLLVTVLVVAGPAAALQPFILALTAGACLLFIRRGRPLFAPWPAPWRRARQV